ncbi:hypothetical protein QUA40_18660 [Microcoleus sp. Pol11C3]|uniref:hypothetical protein n=1 Tax=Microcoleus sp. Pol11C3 TaxID=3055390 RepID=UPI002FD44FF0
MPVIETSIDKAWGFLTDFFHTLIKQRQNKTAKFPGDRLYCFDYFSLLNRKMALDQDRLILS